ncbi:acyltransferase family protein [Curtobacterium flaccumfaciens]|uniref:acyltransferase family protein n=1 Tax=Curtobacterium flaccumfaciens TaxID=2035 RepID=UPI000FFEC4E6|nr:acyltransferase [Curtobacterium flaccumfaciens]MCS0645335.1 acyltransferase [Curtobacterium flaccumfaciens pv. flaccumfaciens]MCS6527349.1 acyltransferase [Curtobacterium flaccumfaciens pv. flaccumfaciens]MCS6530963.1 acyltransferase [Curtobacterium flaccumfaciens pv. flaccumfaciens]MCS6560228.1 acyltransferase [Curtobacterium flaccumfaciens]NUU09439.1 acyltransferase [Curtobacterium flaccumfaciens]
MEESANRIGALDGLRGIAALVVLIHHSFVSVAPLGDVYFDKPAPAALAWLVASPIHLVWAGPEAVYVFFILSGLVLTLPALRRRYDWKAYYPSRLIRLYLPVVVAVLFALALSLAVPRAGTAGRGTWMENHDQAPSLFAFVRNATLISPDWLNPPLWSLRWEVAFSVLLPLYVFIALRCARWRLPLLLGAIALSAVGTLIEDKGLLIYLPMFLIGAVLAPVLSQAEASTSRRWPWIMGASLIGITCTWWLGPSVPADDAVTLPIVLLSALAIVVSAVRWQGARAFLERPVVQWFGRISFSLYLTHDPIVVATGTLLPVDLAWLTPLVCIPVSIAVAYIFFRLVEHPAHLVAKRVASRLKFARRVAMG